MTMLLAEDAFKIVADVGHPRVKVDYDLYHRQLGEGNLINELKRGLDKGYIQFVEVGDVPGRKEPGTGEVNYSRVFRLLRETGYSGFVGMEHGTSSTPEHAMEVVTRFATES
jgi:hydroxypyruvate isomerase